MATTLEYSKLIKRAKVLKISTVKELENLISNEFENITGADFEIAKKQLKL